MISNELAVQGLIGEGAVYPGAHVIESERHPWLMDAAQQHAQMQADAEQCGHQGFMQIGFADKAMAATQCEHVNEIAAESWADQTDSGPQVLGKDAFDSWRQSPGHWSVVCVKHKYFGAGMACGKNGVWYSTILVTD